MNTLVTLQFPDIDSDLLDQFPVDKDSDITLVFPQKMDYRLRKSILRRWSNYYNNFFGNEVNGDAHIILISKKFDPTVYHNVLNCFYGFKYQISKDADVYSAYHIAQNLEIDYFTRLIENCLLENYKKMNFLYIFSLAEQYDLFALKEKCIDYAQRNHELFLKLLDIKQLELFQVRGPSCFQLTPIERPPENILLLKEETFKQIIQLHNQQKKYSSLGHYLNYEEIFKILKYFVKIRIQKLDQRKEKLRDLVSQLIDPKELTSKQYKFIYGDLLIQQRESLNETQVKCIDDEDSLFYISSSKIKNIEMKSSYLFDPKESEILYLKKQLQEKEESNQSLKQEIRYLKEELEVKNRRIAELQGEQSEKLQNINKNLEERVNMITKLCQNLQTEKSESNCTQSSIYIQHQIPILDKSHLVTNNQNSNNNNNNNSQLTISQFKIQQTPISQDTSIQQNQISINSSFQQKRIIFDSTPQSIFESKELFYLLDICQIDIFEQLQLKLMYRGSQQGCQTLHIEDRDNLLFLIRSADNDRSFGFCIESQNQFILDITNQKYFTNQFTIDIGNGNLIKFGNYVIIKEDCCNNMLNICNQSPEFGLLAASQKFQVDEFEVYQIQRKMAMI